MSDHAMVLTNARKVFLGHFLLLLCGAAVARHAGAQAVDTSWMANVQHPKVGFGERRPFATPPTGRSRLLTADSTRGIASAGKAIGIGAGLGAVVGLVAGIRVDRRSSRCHSEQCEAGPNLPVTPLFVLLGGGAGGLLGLITFGISRVP